MLHSSRFQDIEEERLFQAKGKLPVIEYKNLQLILFCVSTWSNIQISVILLPSSAE